MGDTYQDILALVQRQSADQKAREAQLTADVKENVAKERAAQEEQLLQLGNEGMQKNANARAVANNLTTITQQLKADPTDPTSLMARNNVAIAAFNEQLLADLQIAGNIRKDTSFMGALGELMLLPDVQNRAAQTEETITQLNAANNVLTLQMNNQTAQIQNAVKLGNTQLQEAETAKVMALTQAGIAKDRLLTAEGLYRIQATASGEALQLAQVAAKAKEDMLLAPLRLAIAKGEAAKYADEVTIDTLYMTNMGWDKETLKQMKFRMRSDPMLSQAIDHFAITGEYLNPDDAELIGQWMNKKNLVYKQDTQRADGSVARAGSPLPALASIQEATRPLIKSRVEGLMNEVIADMKKNNATDAQMAKVMSSPGLRRVKLQEFAEKNKARDEVITADLISANPNQIYQVLPRLAEDTPAIKAIAAKLGNDTVDIAPVALIDLLLKGNMDVKVSELAKQGSIYFQNIKAYDAARPIYGQLGIKRSNSVVIPVTRTSMPKQAINVLVAKGLPFLETATVGRLDPSNEADLAAYMRDRRAQAEFNAK